MRCVALLVLAMLSLAMGASVHDVSFWVEEGKFLNGDLQAPPALGTNFHNSLVTSAPLNYVQLKAVEGCSGNVEFTAVNTPAHYTQTPAGYTPAVGPFTLQLNGKFQYVHLPAYVSSGSTASGTATSGIVWNGYDFFDFDGKCASVLVGRKRAFINVVYTSANTYNTPVEQFGDGYNGNGGSSKIYILCEGTCEQKDTSATNPMWYARQTLPRLWDVMADENGALVRPTLMWEGVQKDGDALEFEWSSNYGLVSTYGTIGNMAVRFPTMEEVTWKPGQFFEAGELATYLAATSTGFDQTCLSATTQGRTGDGNDVWHWTTYPTAGQLGAKYNTDQSWYQKFGGKHTNCNIFASHAQACSFAPLLTPRTVQTENTEGVWKVHINGCATQWQGKFSWNAMRTQTLKNTNKAWAITNGASGQGYTITANFYNQAVQPNSWTEPARGFAWLNKKYLLTVVLRQDTDFQFELGIDIFTVDLQWFRFQESSGDHAFGYNMIVYPARLDTITAQSQPDRRIKGFKWTKHTWVAPTSGANSQCSGCTGTVTVCQDTDFEGTLKAAADYTGAFPTICPRTGVNSGRVFLYKGPSTSRSECTNVDRMTEYVSVDGISPQNPTGGPSSTCDSSYQNITFRGVAPGSSAVTADNGFGFEGVIYITFLLANGEHPQFQITPKLFIQSLSVQGSFSGSTATCRGSPKWPVPASGTDAQRLPTYLCEEVDARTFGPTDWAIIMFDIKDVDHNLVELKKLDVRFAGITDHIILEQPGVTTFTAPEVNWSVNYGYLHYINLKANGRLYDMDGNTRPSYPTGIAEKPPANMDFGFAFTPGAHNENVKITIYCTLRIRTTTLPAPGRRFHSAQDAAGAPPSENLVSENINIQKNFNKGNAALTLGGSAGLVSQQQAQSSAASASADGSKMTVAVLAAVCAVLLAAVVGMAIFVRSRMQVSAPKRVSSGTALA